MKSVGTRIQDNVVTAIENLVLPRVELAINSANALSGQSVEYWNVITGFSGENRKLTKDRSKQNKLAYRLKKD